MLRGLLLVGGALLAFAGLGIIAVDRSALVPGLYALALGLVAVIAAPVERQRYRSALAERTDAPPGPGGGEPPDVTLEPTFQPTEERFVDPTTNRRMRVWLDARTGERRYREEP